MGPTDEINSRGTGVALSSIHLWRSKVTSDLFGSSEALETSVRLLVNWGGVLVALVEVGNSTEGINCSEG